MLACLVELVRGDDGKSSWGIFEELPMVLIWPSLTPGPLQREAYECRWNKEDEEGAIMPAIDARTETLEAEDRPTTPRTLYMEVSKHSQVRCHVMQPHGARWASPTPTRA